MTRLTPLMKSLVSATALATLGLTAGAVSASASPDHSNHAHASKRVVSELPNKATRKPVANLQLAQVRDRDRDRRRDRTGERRRDDRRTDRRRDDRRAERRREEQRAERRRSERRAERRREERRTERRRNQRRSYGYSHRRSGWGYGNRSHRNNYRSNVGITFSFGNNGYSRHRWSPGQYSFYQPQYGNYTSYRNQTFCQRVLVDAWHHGHYETVSVKQCSNPWDGTYIIQGSERIVDCRY